MPTSLILLLVLGVAVWVSVDSFQASIATKSPIYHHHKITSTSTPSSLFSSAISLSDAQGFPANPGPHIKIKGRILNPWGVYCATATFVTAILVYPLVLSLAILSDLFGNKRQRRPLDWIVHVWAKITILLCGGRPKLYGIENLPKPGEAVIYVPNHTSFLDILFFSGFVPRPFKYFSKAEIGKIPVIGSAMALAKHVFLKRNDIESTLEATSTCVQRLKDGNSMVLFAEGTRSNDGRLKNFKKGTFQIAKEAQVKIIPVSIGNLYKWMPNAAILPLAPMRDTYIKIHPALETDKLPPSQLKTLCVEAVNSGLPEYQQSLSLKASNGSSSGPAKE
jgi:1-acyl-sn-glycerol-3-phosphate acyltransferase